MRIKGRPHLEVVPHGDSDLVIVRATCGALFGQACRKVTEFTVNALAFQDWARDKGYVQDLGLTDDQCEAILSGTCPTCWDTYLDPGDD